MFSLLASLFTQSCEPVVPMTIEPKTIQGVDLFFFVDQSTGTSCEISNGSIVGFRGKWYEFSCSDTDSTKSWWIIEMEDIWS